MFIGCHTHLMIIPDLTLAYFEPCNSFHLRVRQGFTKEFDIAKCFHDCLLQPKKTPKNQNFKRQKQKVLCPQEVSRMYSHTQLALNCGLKEN